MFLLLPEEDVCDFTIQRLPGGRRCWPDAGNLWRCEPLPVQSENYFLKSVSKHFVAVINVLFWSRKRTNNVVVVVVVVAYRWWVPCAVVNLVQLWSELETRNMFCIIFGIDGWYPWSMSSPHWFLLQNLFLVFSFFVVFRKTIFSSQVHPAAKLNSNMVVDRNDISCLFPNWRSGSCCGDVYFGKPLSHVRRGCLLHADCLWNFRLYGRKQREPEGEATARTNVEHKF